MANRISRKFAQLKANNKKALITYVTAGDPNLKATADLVLAMEQAGADIIELGIPYSDPLADGPVIQAASRRALQGGTTLAKIFDMITGLRQATQVPLVLMTYINPIIQYGVENFAAQAAQAGVDGLIIPDLPLEEMEILHEPMKAAGVVIIPLVAPTSTNSRIAKIAEAAQGFIYCVSLTGVTGVREQGGQNVDGFIKRVREYTDKPLAVGFGVATPQQAAQMVKAADGVIVGSALVQVIANLGDRSKGEIAHLVKSLKDAI